MLDFAEESPLSIDRLVADACRPRAGKKLDSKMNDRPIKSGVTGEFGGKQIRFSLEDVEFCEGTYRGLIG